MKIEFWKIRIELELLDERPERAYYSNGLKFASVRPMFEIGVDERLDFKIYYVGMHRLSLAFSYTPDRYVSSWVAKEEALSKCLPFKRNKKKRFKDDPFNRPMGDKPSA